jgi:Holliday junction resolvase RusA-like endonuclease
MAAPEPVRTPPTRLTAAEYRALGTGRRQGARGQVPRRSWVRKTCAQPFRLALPFLPPSVNKLFTTVRDPDTGVIKRVLTQNARRVRRLIQAMIGDTLDPSRLYELRIDVYLRAWTKSGKVRRVDLSNRVKFLEDCVCGALGIDDSHVFRIVLEKHDSDSERTVMHIREIETGRGEQAA